MNRIDNRAHTFTELVFASVITVILVASVLGAFVFTKQVYVSSIARSNLQRDVDIALLKIIKGKREGAVIFRLAEARYFAIPGGLNNTKLQFWGTDNKINDPPARWYCLDNKATSIIYHHPGPTGAQDEIIYTAPSGAALSLQFQQFAVINPPPGVDNNTYLNIDVGINIAVSQNIYGQNISGSAYTVVNVRNHS